MLRLRPSPVLCATDWSSTLNLPRSTLPARPILEKRAQYIQKCSDDLYAWQRAHRPASSPFVLHDGPPYANGSLHTGHALNKILKDIFCRFQLSQGKRVHYVPGWDCHGLPIELKALQSQSQDAQAHTKMSAVDIRKAARELATRTVEEQKKNFREWAIMGDWDNAWQTMQKGFELKQLEVFKEMVDKGLIYRQFKPVYWSPSSGTALAEAELEYDENHVSHSAYIKFRLVTLPKALRQLRGKGALYALIWTTTPWTLPANSAIAVHNDIEYTVFRRMYDTDLVLCAKERIPEVLLRAGLEEKDIDIVVESVPGSAIAGQAVYWNSLRGRESGINPIVHADFVTLASGSGLVHMAPGHGFDDYNVCLKHDIPVFAPVDDHGCFTDAALPDAPRILKGKDIFTEGGKAVIDLLKSGSREGGKDLVWATHRIKHKYPIDWRTKKPLIIRATAQWFAGVDTIKDHALASLRDVKFLPETGRSRLESFVAGRSQWCISRQRAWGVPIPALYRIDTKGKSEEAVMTAESVQHIIGVIRERGTDAWWTDAEDDIAWISPSLPQATYRRGKDTMDVWFDSGTSWTQLPQDRSPPADVYIEGTDQHRGWFQSSLLTYVAQQAQPASSGSASEKPHLNAPYKTLITHGFILDALGRKMSKSIGNVIAPSQITDGTLLPPLKKRKGQSASDPASYDAMGPDALRLWVASSDYKQDVMIGQPVLKAVNSLLHKLRVTFKWLLGALEDFDPAAFAQSSATSTSTTLTHTNHTTFATQAATHHLSTALHTTHTALTAYEPHRAILALSRYITADLSAFYFEYAKDLLYAGTAAQRKEVQAMCWSILQGLLTMLAPVTPVLVAEVVEHAPVRVREVLESEEGDPFRRVWSSLSSSASPSATASSTTFIASETNNLQNQLTNLTLASTAIKAAQELARAARVMGSGLECRVELILPASTPANADVVKGMQEFFTGLDMRGELAALLVVSEIEVVDALVAELSREHDLGVSAEEEERKKDWVFERSFVIPTLEGSDVKEEERMVIARVLPPRQAKCPRCWRYQAPKPKVEEEEVGLCGRCEVAMAEKADVGDGPNAKL